MFLVRLCMLIICYPIMAYLSEGYSMNDVLFSVFAGLRGAVSLSLCIVIQTHIDSDDNITYSHENESIIFPKNEIRQVIFILSGVVALTILINGALSRSYYSFLYTKADRKTAQADLVILHYVRKRIWQKAEIGNKTAILTFHHDSFLGLFLRTVSRLFNSHFYRIISYISYVVFLLFHFST